MLSDFITVKPWQERDEMTFGKIRIWLFYRLIYSYYIY